MTVFPSTLIASTVIPTDPEQVWSPHVLPMANWRDKVITETTWKTGVQAARSGSEQRAGLRLRPVRVVEALTHGWSCDEAAKLRTMIMRFAHARSLVPIYSDRQRLTGWVPPSTTNTYLCDTTNRRFFVGQRVIVAKHNRRPFSPEFVIRTITAKTDTTVTLDSDLNEADEILPTIDEHGQQGTWKPASPYNISISPFTLAANQGAIAFCHARASSGLGAPQITTPPTWDAVGVNEQFTQLATHVGTSQRTYIYALSGNSAGTAKAMTCTWTMGFGSIEFAQMVVMTFNNAKDDPFTVNAYDPQVGVASSPPIGDLTLFFDAFTPTQNINLLVASTLYTVLYSPNLMWHEAKLAPEAGTRDIALATGNLGSRSRYEYGYWDEKFGNALQDFEAHGQHYNSTTYMMGGVAAISPKFPGPYDVGLTYDFIYPCMEAEVIQVSTASMDTDQKTTHTITALEVAGKPTLPPLSTPGANPSGYTVYDSLPILDKHVDWQASNQFVDRIGQKYMVGTGSSMDLFGSRGRIGYELSMTFKSRADVFDFLRFFDSRAGSTYPFWILPPMDDLCLDAIVDSEPPIIRVSNDGFPLIDLQTFYSHVILEKYDGSVKIFEIDTVGVGPGATWQIEVVESVAGWDDLTEIRKASIAFKCRFRADNCREEWITNEVCEISIDVIEVQDEKDFQASNMDTCPGGSGDPWTEDPDYDICADSRCGTDQGGGCCICTENAVTLECWCYTHPAGEECENPCDGACTENGHLSIPCTFVSCTATTARWEGANGAYVELNFVTASWSWSLGTNDCCEEVENPGICLCASCNFEDCDPIITESCGSYLKEVACELLSGCGETAECNYVPVIKITCPGCGGPSSNCA